MTVLQSMKLGIDVNRHKEILVKAVAAILLLLLKHLKMNHVYQFEFMSQHLVFANCIPLVLKFFNQNIMAYIGAKNKYVLDESFLEGENCYFSDVTIAASLSWISQPASLATSQSWQRRVWKLVPIFPIAGEICFHASTYCVSLIS